MADALILFVRNPELGKVKTRLAATVGQEAALRIYRQLLQHTLHITQSLPARKYVFYAGAVPQSDSWQAAGYRQRLQSEGDLGEKMRRAFETVFGDGCQQAVIIGSDCPELTSPIVALAFEQLRHHDVVIGPAEDGGYYLLGMKMVHPALFAGMQWSTATVYDATMRSIRQLGLDAYILPRLADIDTEEDWRQAQRKGLLR